MTEALNCPSCGGANKLPEGRNSMFCAFCGTSYQALASSVETKKEESSIKTKPEISKKKTRISETRLVHGEIVSIEEIIDKGGKLALINRNIKSLDEISFWFSDNELSKITNLILKDNKIKNFVGIERYSSLETIDLSNNEISALPEKSDSIRYIAKVIIDGNPILRTITKEQLTYYSNIKLPDLKVKCLKCGCEIHKTTAENNKGLCVQCNYTPTDYEQKKTDKPATKKDNCFIATATMGSYNHPTVIELRHFRDNWILEKKWGASFVSWYYHYGAIAGKSIEKSFVLKKICYLLIVKPLVYLSRIVK